ncbi:MAG: YwqG family protein, partial [Polyangiaceae bacterium]|nr:YwqG family protein [Polyangiaceae bacterium]
MSLSPQEVEDAVDKLAVSTVHLISTDKHTLTKIGGQPLGGPSFEWPKWNDRSLAFLMQIKLDEVFVDSDNKQIHNNGILYVFYDQEQSTWGLNPNDR